MKDKLTKHNHSFAYFICRKIGMVSLVCLSFGALISIPTYINIKTANIEKGKAEVNDKDDSTEEKSQQNYQSF